MHYLINTQKDIDDACRHLADEAVIGVDTEFLRVRTYFPKLALVQLSTTDAIYCVDPLVDGMELGSVWGILADPGIRKVMHAARQDIEVLLHTAGVMPGPLFDTQIAAALLGYGDQVGYARLVEAEYGEALPKSVQRTDWTRRPLSDAQLGYAENDVRYLIPLYESLSARLKTLGRFEWALADFERVLDPALYEADPEEAYQRVGRGAHLAPRAQHALKRLCAWRERVARGRDLPRHWVVDDETLASIAAREPQSVEELKRVEGMRRDVLHRDGRAIIAHLRQPVQDGGPLWARRRSLTPEQKATRLALIEVLRARAAELGVAESVLATRSDLDRLARGAPVEKLITGWRWEAVGQGLKQVLAELPASGSAEIGAS